MNWNRLHPSTSLLGLLALAACNNSPCTDDGFFQDDPAGCDAVADGSSGGGSTGDTTPTSTMTMSSSETAETDSGTMTATATMTATMTAADTGTESDSDTETDAGTDTETDSDADSNSDTEAATCDDGNQNGDETDVDCGGDCDPCDDGGGCEEDEDCTSLNCADNECAAPTCDDNIQNGTESDVDCGGDVCDGCPPGDACGDPADCQSGVCNPDDSCSELLTVEGAPSCSTISLTTPTALLTATAAGGSGTYAYEWTPPEGLLTPMTAVTTAMPTELTSYTITVDDGVNTASDTVTVVNGDPFNLQDNCTLYQGDFGGSSPATISYDQFGNRACEAGNNQFGLHLCESTVFENTRLSGRVEVLNDGGDDDWIGLVWGAQNSSNFYSLSWKGQAQSNDDCDYPTGIVVKRVEAASFDDLESIDLHCPIDTNNSELLLDPGGTTDDGWSDNTSYTVNIDFTSNGSTIEVTDDADDSLVALFDVDDNTFDAGFFGSLTQSQESGCVGPLFASCLEE